MKTNIALCSLNPTVGALAANAAMILRAYEDAVAQGADIVVTPEMSLTGYPLEDLTQKPAFLRDVERARLNLCAAVRATGHDAALLFGHPTDTGEEDGNRRLVLNSATFVDPAACREAVTYKRELPNYGVFDELRNYVQGPARVMNFRGLRLGVLICEDGWFPAVGRSLASQGADVLLWMNGSPFAMGKNVLRRAHASDRVADARVPIAYVNLVGGQDELVFDGDCFAFDGSAYVETEPFRTGIRMASFDLVRNQSTTHKGAVRPLPRVEPTSIGDAYRAKVLGLRDYMRKTGFRSVVIGMSGGIDSAAAASICVDAIGAPNVHLVRLPSGYSSRGSLDDAAECRDLLGCPMRTIVIEDGVNAARRAYETARWDTPRPDDVPDRLAGVSDENIQARQRAQNLMSISNMENRLLVTTGNKSEVSTGFATLGGDMMGGYNVLKDLLKTEISVAADREAVTQEDVERLCAEFGDGIVQWRNRLSEEDVRAFGFHGPAGTTVPLSIQVKFASAELAPDQRDSNSLPAYPILDGILRCLINLNMGVEATIASDPSDPVMASIMAAARLAPDQPVEPFTRHDVERTNRRINASEYKRRQAAPGPKISGMHHGRDRRVPMVNAYEG